MPSRAEPQRLNPVDVAMLCVDQELRSMGCPGFQTQMLVWLLGRVCADRLRRAISRLSRRHSIIAARVVESDSGIPYWRFRPGAECPLQERQLTSADEDAVLDAAAKLLSIPNDPAVSDPIQFHLLHRPDGSDVFLMQYIHALMDNSATVGLLREIDGLSQGDEEGLEAPAPPVGNVLRNYLRQFSRQERRRAAQHAIQIQGHVLRGRAAMLGGAGRERTPTAGLQIATRELNPSQTRAIQERVMRVCGFPSLSMALLASTFRAIAWLAPDERASGRSFVAGIGMDLNQRKEEGSLFGNLMSLAPISARPEELEDRDQLICRLNQQMRERLTLGFDLGTLWLNTVFSRRPRHIRWVLGHVLRYSYSLWYAYFGSLDAAGDSFCGTDLAKVFYTGPAWLPLGVTILGNQHRGRLLLQATYLPEVAPAPLVQEYLDLVIQDLLQ